MASVKLVYASSSSKAVTTLDGLASSSTWLKLWTTVIDNTSDLYLDYRVTAKITVESSSLSAGEIRLYLVGPLDDSTWPDTVDGTSDDVDDITDTEIRDAICRLGAMTITDTTASRVYYLDCPSVASAFGGNLPKKFVIGITQSTGTTLETSGNGVYVTGVYATVA